MSKYKNKKGEDVDVLVKVYTRPNLRDGTHEMLLYNGRHFIENIFDKKVVCENTTDVFMYYPETWANIAELQSLMEFVFHFYPNIKKLSITTHSVYIIQTTYAEHIRIYDNPTDYPQTSEPMDKLAPSPDKFEGLWANGVKIN